MISKKTKVVCTIGPKTADPESIKQLISLGMNIVRLNGSHNTIDWHRSVIRTIRDVNAAIPILVDLPGRKIRTQKGDYVINFKINDILIFTSNLSTDPQEKISLNYNGLHDDVSPGNIILADDGTLKFIVDKIVEKDIYVKALSNGKLTSAKGINVPYVKVKSKLISDKDMAVLDLCKSEGVDYVGVSFVENANHVKEVYSLLSGAGTKVISKIENQFGLNNLGEIMAESAAILVDRGDLSAETNSMQVGVNQKIILDRANKFGCPVIIATEMLHTMIENPQPTRAEVLDITCAVFDGASAVMMSGETAIGKYPFEACKTMSDVIIEAENYMADIGLVFERLSDFNNRF
jgi:pyruvate kinase